MAMFGYDMAGLLDEVMYYERDSGTKETSTERTVGAGNRSFILVWGLYLMHLFFFLFFYSSLGYLGFKIALFSFHAILRLSFPTFPMSSEYCGVVR